MSESVLDPRQSKTDEFEAAHAGLDGRQSQIHTSMPGIIISFDATRMTATVRPALKGIHTRRDGKREEIQIAQLQDVPVFFPGGGAHTLTFPIKAGDECILIFQERSIDFWHQLGDPQRPSDFRMHDINDAIALVGLRSQPRVPAAGVSLTRHGALPSTQGGSSPTTTQLRSDDAKTLVQVDGPNHAVTLYTSGAGEAVVFVDGAGQEVTLLAQNVQLGKSGGNLGVLGATPIAKRTITGSAGGNVALKNLLQFLQSRGDIVDGST